MLSATVYVSAQTNWTDTTHPGQFLAGDTVTATLAPSASLTTATWEQATGGHNAAYPSLAEAQSHTLSGAADITSGTTVQMGAGTYDPATISISSVTIDQFPNAAVKFNFNPINPSSKVLDVAASGVTIKDVTVSNQSGQTGVIGIDVESAGLNCTVNNVTVVNGAMNAVGIALNAGTAVIEASNIESVTGVQVNGVTATIQTSTITDGVTGIDIEGSATPTVITNFITGNTGAAVNIGSGSPTVVLQQNYLGGNATDAGTFVVNNLGSTTLDAAENYWGAGPIASVPALVHGNLNFEPIVTSGTDTDLVAPGFQPNVTSLAVDVSSATPSPTEGATYTLNLAPTNPASNNNTITQWVVNWGDFTSNTYKSTDPGGIPNSPTHTYAEEGSYTITATATDEFTNTATTTLGSFAVADPAVVPSGLNFSAVTGVAFSNVPVATFTDPGGAELISGNPNPASYSAMVDWGDSKSPTVGTITYDATSETFTVLGSHTYANSTDSPYTITVSITHELLSPVTATSHATVGNAVWVNDNWDDAANPGNPQFGDTVTAPRRRDRTKQSCDVDLRRRRLFHDPGRHQCRCQRRHRVCFARHLCRERHDWPVAQPSRPDCRQRHGHRYDIRRWYFGHGRHRRE